MRLRFLLISILIMLGVANAQSVCNNEDFEVGNTSGWDGETGNVNTSGVNMTGAGIVNGRHTIMTGTGVDPIAAGCGVNIPVVCPGGTYSLRLGNSSVGAEAESITKVFSVTPQNTFFFYKYAVILNDPSGHSLSEKPRFEVRVYNSIGNVIPCGEYIVKAMSSIPGFINCGNWRIRDWTSAGIDLSAFLGQTVTIEFLTTDCTKGGHAGYAYIDASCQDLNLLGSSFCPDSSYVNVTAPDGFDSYVWYSGETTQTINIQVPNVGDTISVYMVNDITGCGTNLVDTLKVAPEMTVPAPFDTVICVGDTLDFDITGNHVLSYTWPDLGLNVPYFKDTLDSTYTYEYIVVDTFNCFYVHDSIEVFIDPLEVTLKPTDVNCYDSSDGSAQVNYASGNLPLIYAWGDGTTNSDILNQLAGDYYVTITDSAGCSIDTVVTIGSPPDILMSATKSDLLCFNDGNGSIDFTTSGGVPNYLFSWSNGEVTEDINNLSGGSYTITISDHNSCVKDTTIFIYEPQELDIRGTSSPDYCDQNIGSINLNISGGEIPYTYNWTPVLPNASAVNNLASGTYNIQIIDSNLCVKDSNIVIQNIPPPVASFTYTDVCEDSLIALLGDAPGSNIINWSWDLGDGRTNSGQNLSISYPQFGTYNISMEVVDVNNCTTTVQNLINIHANPIVAFAPDTMWGCEELEVSFQDLVQTDPGSSYTWVFEDHGMSNQNSPIVTFKGAGQYGVGLSVETPHGCVAADYIYDLISIYSDPVADFDFTPKNLGILDPLVDFTDLSIYPYTWSWTFGDGGSSTEQHPQYIYSDTGVYNIQLVVTTENTCIDSIDKWITVKPDYLLHIPNVFTPNGDLQNDVFLPVGVFHGIGEYTFRIFNRWGEQILENYDVNEGWNGGFYNDLGIMSPDGAYVYTISVVDLFGMRNEYKGTVLLLK